MGRLLSDAFGEADWSDAWWQPAADVEETAEAYVVELELPGIKRKDISIEFGGGELAVTGEVKERQRGGIPADPEPTGGPVRLPDKPAHRRGG